MIQGCAKEDIKFWNMDKTGVFWRALPDRTVGLGRSKGKQCKGGKKGKHRITVAFFVSASSIKEKPIVIWKSKNPRCLKLFYEVCFIPVKY